MTFNILINKGNATIEEVTLFNYSPDEAKDYARSLSDKYAECDVVLRVSTRKDKDKDKDKNQEQEKENNVHNWRRPSEDGATTVKSLI